MSKCKGQPNESGISVITPQFEETDDCACSSRKRRVLGMYAISSDPARCMYDSWGELKDIARTSRMPPNGTTVNPFTYCAPLYELRKSLKNR
ncbi:hypothetical protein TNCV_4652621 [Trichonephila clavipes]|nr:hypothetical protein TNCV_4652621 [Trichonephila clavipes]